LSRCFGNSFPTYRRWGLLAKIVLNNKIERISAGIKHVIDTSRESGHCYLRFEQIEKKTVKLLNLENKEIINKK